MNHKALTAATLVGLIAGCTAGTSTNGSKGNGSNHPKVTLVQGVKGSPFYIAMACGAQSEATKLGARLSVTAPDQFDPSLQVPVVNSVTAKHPDAAIIVPTDAKALIPPMRAMKQAGVQVVEADQQIADNSIAVSSVASDNITGGHRAADEMVKLISGRGSVLVITQPPGSTAQDERTKGFEQEIKKNSGVTYLGPQYQSDDPAKAASIVTSTLAKHPNLAGIFATNDQGAIGAATGLRNAKATGRVKLVAYDAAQAEVAALKSGEVQALIAQQPFQEGVASVQQAVNAVQNKSVQKVVNTQLITLTRRSSAADLTKYTYKPQC